LCRRINTKKWVEKNREHIKNINLKWRNKNKEHLKEYSKQWFDSNPNYRSKYVNENYVHHRQICALWNEKNKKKIQERQKYRSKYDLCFILRARLRKRLRDALKNNYKVGSAVGDLGCSIEYLKQHLEQKFYINPETNEIMTWENYGLYGWHIDHIIPLSSFDLTSRSQFLKACHYTNLQPLWAKDNLKKGAKVIYKDQKSINI